MIVKEKKTLLNAMMCISPVYSRKKLVIVKGQVKFF
jgi:hypothetical protein